MEVFTSTTDFVAGFRIVKHIDLVTGTSVRATNELADRVTSIPQIFGGEMSAYSNLIEDTKNLAIQKMIQKARAVSANAVVGIRLQLINENRMTGVLASGTAVLVTRNE
jgi:uncharacterized protein YbjQ (UPF0145 family)